MTEPEKIDVSCEFTENLEGLTDEEILRLVIRTNPESSPRLGDATTPLAGKAIQGLELIREAIAAAAGRSSEALLDLPNNQLTRRLVQTTDAPAPLRHERGAMVAGRYRLVSLIGEGGMGSVWVAEQRVPVRRRVALKLIKPGMDSRQVLHRFEAERQALAAMDHPNIARILDGGLADDQHPFFAMELVNGACLTKFCDEARIGIRERLEIFRQIAQAIQHAHHRGILHRDLKPSNILVTVIDGVPVPKVIDFGLAKVLGSQIHADSMQTGFGAVVGTIEYMAPEQAGYSGQDVDTRADIYSLGVILYELLTGLPPFDSERLASAALDEMLRIIKDEDPIRPSIRLASSISKQSCAEARRIEPAKLSGILKNELDWIVMKALDKDRNRRYETANSLAADIQSYLSGEPVSAHPPSSVYRIRKFIRRHRVQVIAAALVTLAIAVGIAGMAIGLFHAKKQERIAIKQEQLAVAETKAKTQALQAEQIARANEKNAQDQALAALRAMTDEFVQSELARETRISHKEQTYLRNIIRQFDLFANFDADDAGGAAIRAEGRFRVGRIYSYLGETSEAEIELRKSAEIYLDLVQESPDQHDYQRCLARSQSVLGKVLMQLGRQGDARAVLDDSYRYWKEIAVASPTESNLESYADVCTSIARVCQSLQHLVEAERTYREVLTVRQELADDFPRPENRASLASCLNVLAGFCRQSGKHEEAAQLREKSLVIRKQIARRYSARPDFVYGLSISFCEMGQAAIENGQWSEAEAAYEEACRILEDLASQFPSKFEYTERLADALNGLAKSLENQDRDRESMTVLSEAISIREELALKAPERPNFRKDLAKLKFNLGRAYRRHEMNSEAESIWQQTILGRETLAKEFVGDGANAMELARVLQAVSLLYFSQGQNDEAVKFCQRAVTIRREWVSREPTRTQWRKLLATNLLDYGRMLADTSRSDESESILLESRSILEELASTAPAQTILQSDVANCSINLGNTCLKRRDFEAAEKYLSEAMSSLQTGLESKPTDSGFRAKHVRNMFFLIQLQAGKLDEHKSLETAGQLRDLGWNPSQNAYYAACGLARSIPIVAEHSRLDDQQRAQSEQRYSNLAMEYLTDAVNKGFTKRKTLVTDSDLDPLRDREDFKKLIDDLASSGSTESSSR